MSPKPRPYLLARLVRRLVFAGACLLLLAACSVAAQPAAPAATPTATPEVLLLATATAAAPSEPEMLARLAQECQYRSCDEPPYWGAIVLALEQRPLQLPAMQPGAACPEPAIRSVAGYSFEVVGEGPVYSLFYLLIMRADRTLNSYEQDGWYWNKVVWARDLQYAGPIVIRGRQLDGNDALRFQWMRDGNPAPELAHASLHVPPYSTASSRLTDGSGYWEEMMTWVVVRAPGCYGVQIDGVGFSNVIVFQVHE